MLLLHAELNKVLLVLSKTSLTSSQLSISLTLSLTMFMMMLLLGLWIPHQVGTTLMIVLVSPALPHLISFWTSRRPLTLATLDHPSETDMLQLLLTLLESLRALITVSTRSLGMLGSATTSTSDSFALSLQTRTGRIVPLLQSS